MNNYRYYPKYKGSGISWCVYSRLGGYTREVILILRIIIGIIPNINGRVSAGVYTAGWLGTGPRGVIIDTMNNAFKVKIFIKKKI